MKALPYFRWYPADAETDEAYASLNDTELGFFHRCLNRSWVNGSLPADLDQLAFAMRVRRSYLDKVWQKVGKCFHHVQEGTRLANRRQEEEREHALSKSLANQRMGNANATRSERVRNANAPQRALTRAESVSVSSCDVSVEGGSGETFELHSENGNGYSLTSGWFEQWWEIYWHKRDRKNANTAFRKKVTTVLMFEAVMAATKAQSAEMLSRDPDKRPYGATWLNGERWNDAISAPRRKGHQVMQVQKPAEHTHAEKLEAWRWMAEHDADPEARAYAKKQLQEAS